MKKNLSKIIFFMSLILLNLFVIFQTQINQNRIEQYFRLHITANSNMPYDQTIKLYVAQAVNDYLASILNSSMTKENIKEEIHNQLDNILDIANTTLKDYKCDYTACAKLGNIYYTQRQNSEFAMEAGIYDSCEIVLGNGEGKNFWTLLYPHSYTDACNVFEASNTAPIHLTDISSETVEYYSFFAELLNKLLKSF